MTAFLHHQIPITAAAGLRVEVFEPNHVCLQAPLAPNRNHHGTAFGGSLAMLGVLTGWTLAHAALRGAAEHAMLVIQRSEQDFKAPARSALQASAEVAAAAAQAFAEQFVRRGRARLDVNTDIRDTAGLVCVHRGRYVALAKSGGAL